MPLCLHTHSWYSLLEGASSVEALITRAVACDYGTLALTDTNNLYGAVHFTNLAHQHGIRPLLGACLRQGPTRCVALIAEPVGYRNLCRVLSRLAGVNDLKNQPLVELLADHGEGLHLLVDDVNLARSLREAYRDRLWFEVVRPRPDRSSQAEQKQLEQARRLGLPLVASCAAHFATPEEYHVFRLAATVKRGGLLDQLPARLKVLPEHHLLDRATFQHRFADLPDALRNTERLADQLRADVLPRDIILPPARIPRSLQAHRFLELLCERGLRRRDLGQDLAARDRLRGELAVIAAGGLAEYFLVVRDIARYARQRHYHMALRGSAGNSLVCYLLEITEVNPLRFNLRPERFLHPGRVDLPDIDLDFDWKIRDEVLAHVFERYGPRHSAMISSHLFLQPRSAFREAAKLHGLSNEQIGQLSDRLEERVEKLVADDALKKISPPPAFPLEPVRWPRIVRDARLLLGRPHHLFVHPGGVVLTPRPLEDFVPLERAAKGVIITQLDKDGIEAIGLVKIDLLGNRALGTLDEIAQAYFLPPPSRGRVGVGGRSVNQLPSPHPNPPPQGGEGNEVHILRSPLSLLQQGDTLGINQLESPAMRHLLVQLQPRGVEDVIAALALIRPGAASGGIKERFLQRRHGLEKFFVHPLLAPHLAQTQGFMLYEDDGLHVIEALTAWNVPEAYRFYKRLTKCKGPEEEQRLAGDFLRACADNHVPRDLAVEHFVQLTKFRYYAFCKSHAVSYGLIAWQVCTLKAEQPARFWTAALNNNQGMYPRRVYVEAIKRAGIRLCLPCVNRSQARFSVEEEGHNQVIRIGLDAIATLPEESKQRLLAERNRRGPFRDLLDLRRRVEPGPEALEALIRSGALDFTGLARPTLFLETELQDRHPACKRAGEELFQKLDAGPELAGWQPHDFALEQRLRDEWDLLGFVVGPPLLSLFARLLPADRVRASELASHAGQHVCVAGVVATFRHTDTSDGRAMQFITLEDETGLIELNLFPGNCSPLPHLELGPYMARGIVEESLGVYAMNAEEVLLLEKGR